jgi:RpiR family carbohydrate utilization transcriptional regulator
MRERIVERLEAMSPAERKVAELVAADPKAVLASTMAQIAKGAGVSEPTVVRFCRTLGFDGLAELRLALARAEGAGSPRTPRRIHAGTPPVEAPALVLDGAIAALSDLRRSLDPTAVERAALALVRAERVEVWGLGASAGVAEGVAHGLFRVCRAVVARRDPQMQAMAAATLDGDAVALCVSASGRSREVVEAARLAAAAGATVIALTRPGTPLAAVATLTLAAEAPEGAELHAPMPARLLHLALGDALAVAAALLSPPAAEERLARMQAALRPRRIEGPA